MRFKTFSLVCSALLLSAATSNAQEWCGTTEYSKKLLEQYPSLAVERAKTEAKIQAYLPDKAKNTASRKQNTPRIIPVVVHVVTLDGSGGPTTAQIEGAIQQVNEDFRRQNADATDTRSIYQGIAADTEIELRLAKIDPAGNCTQGIVRVASPLTVNANDDVKAVSYWPRNKYFNIWLVNSIEGGGGGGIILGYAQFPDWGPASTYGFVCRSDYFGPGIRTATHELGHCFNLYHTFESFLNSGSNGCGDYCSTSGDLVCDTPPAAEATWDCNPFQNSCSNDQNGSAFTSNMPDQIENYMSYDQGCQNMFTVGQKDRMDAAFNNYTFLQQLTSPANAIATGIATATPQVCLQKASFTTFSNRYICEGSQVEFTDFSYDAYPDSTWSWNWSFPGGTPSSSTDQNPVVFYNSAGVYDASLTVTSSVGTSTFSRPAYINVKSIQGISAPFTQGIEDPSFPNIDPTNSSQNWTVVSNLTNTWHRVPNAGSQGSSSSLRINNAVIPVTTSNELISPSLNLTGLPSAKLTFDMAYAKREAISTDQLKVYFSTDCGLTWVMRYIKNGDALVTNDGSLVPGFVPSASDWKQVTVAITPSYLVNNLKIKFEMVSGQGNALYLDNINIGGLVGADEKLNSSSLVIYPNPAKDAVMIKLDSPKSASEVKFQLTDMLGRVVISTVNRAPVTGHIEIPVSLNGISSGVYFVRVSDGADIITRKLVVE